MLFQLDRHRYVPGSNVYHTRSVQRQVGALLTVDRVKHAAVGEIPFVRVVPAATNIIYGEEFHFRKNDGELHGELGESRSVVMFGGQFLHLRGV